MCRTVCTHVAVIISQLRNLIYKFVPRFIIIPQHLPCRPLFITLFYYSFKHKSPQSASDIPLSSHPLHV
jgi:hypothetical protein